MGLGAGSTHFENEARPASIGGAEEHYPFVVRFITQCRKLIDLEREWSALHHARCAR
jgi:hypothetical protein